MCFLCFSPLFQEPQIWKLHDVPGPTHLPSCSTTDACAPAAHSGKISPQRRAVETQFPNYLPWVRSVILPAVLGSRLSPCAGMVDDSEILSRSEVYHISIGKGLCSWNDLHGQIFCNGRRMVQVFWDRRLAYNRANYLRWVYISTRGVVEQCYSANYHQFNSLFMCALVEGRIQRPAHKPRPVPSSPSHISAARLLTTCRD